MDEKRPDLDDALRELAAEEAVDAGPHIRWDHLIAYRWGTLPAAEREALQEHLSLCPKCADRLLGLRDLETASAGEGAEGKASFREEAWKSLSPITVGRRVAHEVVSDPISKSQSRVGLTPESFEALLRSLGPDREQAVGNYETIRRGLEFVFSIDSPWSRSWPFDNCRRFGNPEDLAVEILDRFVRCILEGIEVRSAFGRTAHALARRFARGRSSDSPIGRSLDEVQFALLLARTDLAERWDQTASREIQVAVHPRFAPRGRKAPESELLRGGSAVNTVRISAQANGFTVAVNLADHSDYPEIRLELIDRNGRVLWAGRRPGEALLLLDSVTVTIRGLGPGRYRLRIEGRHPGRTELLAKYLLAVEWQETPSGVEWPVGAQGPRWRARPEANEILSRGLGASSRTTAGQRAAQLTSGSLEALLGFLDPDRDQAAFKYEAIRRRLVRLFEWRGFGNPEDLSDETINRVALRLAEGVDVRSADPYGYFCGVAHLVSKETARRVARERMALGREEWQPAPPADLEEDRLACLRHCLERLPDDQRVLVLRYHQEDDHIRSRQALAEELGIPMAALRIRVHRIRRKLEEWVAACLRTDSIRDTESPDRPLPHISSSPRRE